MLQEDEFTLKQRIQDLHAYCRQYRIEQQFLLKRKKKERTFLKGILGKMTALKHEKVLTRTKGN